MKRLYIVVEGQTEESFVKELLYPYMARHGVFPIPVIISTSTGHKGGFVNFKHLRNDIQRLLRTEDNNLVVSSFVDFFKCPALPRREQWENLSSHTEQVAAMEQIMYEEIDDYRFVPYIQLHEFEALLFSSNAGFQYYFSADEAAKTLDIIRTFDNPEAINSSPQGAPSKRLIAIKPDYDKVMEGNLIALEIGLEAILERCPRFRTWTNKLIERCTNI